MSTLPRPPGPQGEHLETLRVSGRGQQQSAVQVQLPLVSWDSSQECPLQLFYVLGAIQGISLMILGDLSVLEFQVE